MSLYDEFCSMELHYVYFSIVFYPCAVSNTIEFLFYLSLTIVHGCLTRLSAHHSLVCAGVMGGRHIWYQSFG